MSGVYRGQPLARWCFEQGYRGKDENGKFSHTLFSGGVWSIPDDQLDEFLKRYVQDLDNNYYHYVNEYTTEYFRMYADIDIFIRDHPNLYSLIWSNHSIYVYQIAPE